MTTSSLSEAFSYVSSQAPSTMEGLTSLMPTLPGDNSTVAANSSSGPRPQDYLEFQIGSAINLYYPPVLAMVGTFGNVMSLLVAMQVSNRHSSPAVYMAALAVLDTIMLQVGLFQYWCLFNFYPHLITKTHCHIMFFVVNMTGNYSHWTIVALTLERLFAVVFPLKFKKFNSVTKTYQTLAAIGLLAVVKNLHYIWNVDFVYNEEAGTAMCAFGIDTQGWWVIAWQWFDTCISTLIPFITIITANFIIIRCLRDKSGILTHGGKISQGASTESSTGTYVSSVVASDQGVSNTPARRPSLKHPTKASPTRTPERYTYKGDSVAATHENQTNASVRFDKTTDTCQVELQVMKGKMSSNGGCIPRDGEAGDPTQHTDTVQEADKTTLEETTTPTKIARHRGASSRERLDPSRLTGMLMAVSIAFVLLTAPLFVFRTYFSFSNANASAYTAAAYHLGHHICHKLWYTNNGINFWLYCIVGRRFRHCLKAMLRRYICCKSIRAPVWACATCSCVKKTVKTIG